MNALDTLSPSRRADRSSDRPASGVPRILVADDQPDVLEALRLLLKAEGYQIETAASPAGVIAAVESREFDVVLMDLNYARDTTSGQEGLDLLNHLRALDATLPIVVMTAWGSVDVAVEAMRRGARDFVQKPWENPRLLAILRTQAELSQALRHGQRLEAENSLLRGGGEGQPTLIAQSPAMQPVLQMIARVGPSDANVLITGENGTGKGLIARAMHAVSGRAAKPMVTVNAGGVSEGVFESELFGHVKGAFTDAKIDRVGRFELADGGTLFLDEIANVPLSQQNKLLRVLETGEFERLGSSITRRVNVRAAVGDQRRSARGSRRRPLPSGSAVPPQYHRDPRARAARAPRGSGAARRALPAASRAALPQEAHRLRSGRDAGPARSQLAGQRPRARSRDRTRRADGPGPDRPRQRPRRCGPAANRRCASRT